MDKLDQFNSIFNWCVTAHPQVPDARAEAFAHWCVDSFASTVLRNSQLPVLYTRFTGSEGRVYREAHDRRLAGDRWEYPQLLPELGVGL